MRRFDRIRSSLSRVPRQPPGPAIPDAAIPDAAIPHPAVPDPALPVRPDALPVDPHDEFEWLDVDDPLDLPRVIPVRAGVYLITDSKGRRLGTIRGDFGIGFTVTYRQMAGHYDSLDAAHAAIAAQAVGRSTSPASAPPGVATA
jgi:hypothetical protein